MNETLNNILKLLLVLAALATIYIAIDMYLSTNDQLQTKYVVLPTPESWFASDSLSQEHLAQLKKSIEKGFIMDQSAEIKRINDLSKHIDEKINAKSSNSWISMLIAIALGIIGGIGGYQLVLERTKNFATDQIANGVQKEMKNLMFEERYRKLIQANLEELEGVLNLASFEKQVILDTKVLLIGCKREPKPMLDLLLANNFITNQITPKRIEKPASLAMTGIDLIFIDNTDGGFDADDLKVLGKEIPKSKPIFYYNETRLNFIPEDDKRKTLLNFANSKCNIYPNLIDLLRAKTYLRV